MDLSCAYDLLYEVNVWRDTMEVPPMNAYFLYHFISYPRITPFDDDLDDSEVEICCYYYGILFHEHLIHLPLERSSLILFT